MRIKSYIMPLNNTTRLIETRMRIQFSMQGINSKKMYSNKTYNSIILPLQFLHSAFCKLAYVFNSQCKVLTRKKIVI